MHLYYSLYNRGDKFVEIMDLKATQGWTSCEAAEFQALFAELRNEKSCDRMEVLAKRFPAKTIQQLSDKYAEVFADMLFAEIDDEPSRNDATSDLHDWYKLLEGDSHDSALGPSVETAFCQSSKQLVLEAGRDQEETQNSQCKSSRKERKAWTGKEHRFFHTPPPLFQFCFINFLFLYIYFIAYMVMYAFVCCMLNVQRDVYSKNDFHYIWHCCSTKIYHSGSSLTESCSF